MLSGFSGWTDKALSLAGSASKSLMQELKNPELDQLRLELRQLRVDNAALKDKLASFEYSSTQPIQVQQPEQSKDAERLTLALEEAACKYQDLLETSQRKEQFFKQEIAALQEQLRESRQQYLQKQLFTELTLASNAQSLRGIENQLKAKEQELQAAAGKLRVSEEGLKQSEAQLRTKCSLIELKDVQTRARADQLSTLRAQFQKLQAALDEKDGIIAELNCRLQSSAALQSAISQQSYCQTRAVLLTGRELFALSLSPQSIMRADCYTQTYLGETADQETQTQPGRHQNLDLDMSPAARLEHSSVSLDLWDQQGKSYQVSQQSEMTPEGRSKSVVQGKAFLDLTQHRPQSQFRRDCELQFRCRRQLEKIKQLKAAVAQLREDKAKLLAYYQRSRAQREEVARMAERMNAQKALVTKLIAEKEELITARAELGDLKRQSASLQGQNQLLRNELHSARQDLQRLQFSLLRSEEKLAAALSDKMQRESAAQRTESQLEQERRLSASLFERLQGKVKELERLRIQPSNQLQLQTCRREIAALRAERLACDNQLVGLRQQAEASSALVQRLKDEVQSLKSQLRGQCQKQQLFQQQIRFYQQKSNRCQSELKEQRQHQLKLEQQLRQRQFQLKQISQRKQEFVQQLQRLRKASQLHNQQLQAKDALLSNAQLENALLQEQVRSFRLQLQQAANYRAQVGELQERLGAVVQQPQQCQQYQEVENLKKAFSESQTQKEQLRVQIKQALQSREQLEQSRRVQTQRWEGEQRKWQKEMSQLEAHIRQKEQQCLSLFQENSQLQEARSRLKTELGLAREELRIAKDAVERQEKEMAEMRLSFRIMGTEREALSEKARVCAKLEEERDRLAAELSARKRTVQTSDQRTKGLEGKLRAMEAELKAKERRISDQSALLEAINAKKLGQASREAELLEELEEKGRYIEELEESVRKNKEFLQREKRRHEAERAQYARERTEEKPVERKGIEVEVVKGFILRYFGSEDYELKLQILETMASVLAMDERERGLLGLHSDRLRQLRDQRKAKPMVEQLYSFLTDKQ